MANFDRVCQVGNVDVIGAVDENNMDKAHTCKEGEDAESHDLILAEQALIANVAAGKTDAYDDCGENGAPPAVQKRRVVGQASPGVWGRRAVEMARYYHGAVEQSSQTLASAEGELFGCRVLSIDCG
jgi:hypothetical protein